MACDYSHYEGGCGYLCTLDQKLCTYNPPNFEKCIQDFQEKVKQHELEEKQ